MTHAIAVYGLKLLFANVLVTQLGFPVPAVPMLIAIGASAAESELSVLSILVVAIPAAMISDSIWYVAGRTYGFRVVKLLGRLAPLVDPYVQQTEAYFERWGWLALVVAKFIPGFSTVAPPLAGSAGMTWVRFLLWDGIGAGFWVVSAVSLGMLFHAEVNGIIQRLQNLETIAFPVMGAFVTGYILYKWWQHLCFDRKMRLARVTVEELQRMTRSQNRPVILDLRSPVSRFQDPRSIPGAVTLNITDAHAQFGLLPKDREIIFYGTRSDEAAAASVARKLINQGHIHVRPLLGGLDAWIAASYEVEFQRVHAGYRETRAQIGG
jgi:membrane protein DedA with SNARE-associated domain/rhodanese-related sulfurtransferase